MEREDRRRKRGEIDEEDADMGEVDEEEEYVLDGHAPARRKVHGFEVNEEVLEVEIENEHLDVRDPPREESGWTEDELDRKLTEEGTKEEVDYMVKKLDMFEFGTLEEAWERGNRPRRSGSEGGRRTTTAKGSCGAGCWRATSRRRMKRPATTCSPRCRRSRRRR